MEIPTQTEGTKVTETATLTNRPLLLTGKKFWYQHTATRLALILIGIGLLCFGTLLFVAKTANPGEPLYTIKTAVTEPVFAASKLNAASRLSYTTYLLERRLGELTTIAGDTSTSSPELLANISSLMEKHTHTIIGIINNNPGLDGAMKINALAKTDTVTRSAETLADNTVELATITDRLTTAEDSVGGALTESITSFVTYNATDTIQSFITTQITAVGEEVVKTAPGSKAQSLVIRRISDAQESIADSKWVDAITYLLRARQAIAVDGYLFSAERGPVDGVEIEAGPVPEGN